MDRATTRRALLLGSAGVAAGLAGCSLPADTAGGGDDEGTLSPVPVPTDEPTGLSGIVGEPVGLGPVVMAVTGAEMTEHASTLGGVLIRREGFDFLTLSVAFVNRSDRYVALAVSRFEVAVSDATFESIEPFVVTAEPSTGGLAFAPGERRAFRLHYRVPEGAPGRLHATVGVRTLPADRFRVLPPVEVDLGSAAARPAALDGSLTAPVLGIGDRADADGLSVRVRRVEVLVEVPTWIPREGHELLAVEFAVRNGSTRPRPAVVGIGGIGGMVLADAAGTSFIEAVPFEGELAGAPEYDAAVPLLPGDSNAGTTVVVVPEGAAPLYLLWTPPAVYWGAGTGVAVNRYVWGLR